MKISFKEARKKINKKNFLNHDILGGLKASASKKVIQKKLIS